MVCDFFFFLTRYFSPTRDPYSIFLTRQFCILINVNLTQHTNVHAHTPHSVLLLIFLVFAYSFSSLISTLYLMVGLVHFPSLCIWSPPSCHLICYVCRWTLALWIYYNVESSWGSVRFSRWNLYFQGVINLEKNAPWAEIDMFVFRTGHNSWTYNLCEKVNEHCIC